MKTNILFQKLIFTSYFLFVLGLSLFCIEFFEISSLYILIPLFVSLFYSIFKVFKIYPYLEEIETSNILHITPIVNLFVLLILGLISLFSYFLIKSFEETP